MQFVTVKKAELFTTLMENKRSHVTEYEKATKEYRDAARVQVSGILKDIEEGKDFNLSIHLIKPESHERDYNRALRMVEMSVEEHIKLTETEFTQLVLDEWLWHNDLKTARFGYAQTLKKQI